MTAKTLINAALFAVSHIAFVVPFVPLANVLPAGLGALSMSSMALALILAARWRLVDRLMGGPDKSYVAHRWLGFLAVSGALGHWALAETVGKGLFPVLAASGESIGTVAALGLVILTAAALIRAIPYHLWKASHMFMGPIFLLAAYHTFFVASPLDVGLPPWILMAGVSLMGLVAWGQNLRRKRAPTRLVTVVRATPFEGGIDVVLRASSPMSSFRPGQFATLARNRARAEAHPFTIAGGDNNARRFLIRAVGDWTDEFVQTVKPGDQFRLGAGTGRFLPQFRGQRKEQIWIAGGVGITPFLAALQRMAPDSGARVTLIYCIRSRASAGALEDIERYASDLPQLELVVLSEQDGDRLTSECLANVLRGLPETTTAYLCGPEGLKTMVTQAWETSGMTGAIHSERFDFRGAYALSDLIYLGKPLWTAARHWSVRERNVPHAPTGT